MADRVPPTNVYDPLLVARYNYARGILARISYPHLSPSKVHHTSSAVGEGVSVG